MRTLVLLTASFCEQLSRRKKEEGRRTPPAPPQGGKEEGRRKKEEDRGEQCSYSKLFSHLYLTFN
ncbi:MAG: hypothetical protein EAZ98_03880 [Oscillatoriales cyanobacterium]|nr:MAG: hypothetical protein EAZ96_26640 [Oscillatoriales cyanobacterium]TAE00517.1 MAG: hypothetical protein EAZ98_03880 [Oscillatoriales cyanobacterium]